MKKALPVVLLLLASCGITDSIHPSRIDIQQGNVVDQKMVAQLRPGMTRSQVRFVMGTPMVRDMFHTDRWDYVYRFLGGNGKIEQRTITVIFEEDTLARMEGDVTPGELDDEGFMAEAAPSPPTDTAQGEVVLPPQPKDEPADEEEEKGFFSRMRDKMGF
ncbi:MAG: outer membrane protein assembly factor BamE [Burkholderiales bacterium]